MSILAVGMLAAVLAAPPVLPLGEAVQVRLPDYRAAVHGFEASPPAWNEGLVNVGWGAAKGDPDRRDGWLRKHWLWLDAVDRSADSASHRFLEHRGVFYDVYGYNEYQETIFVREKGSLDLLVHHGGIARTASDELFLHQRFSTDEQKRKYGRGNVYRTDQLDSRWSAIVGYDWLTSPLLGDGISQDNIGVTIPKTWTFGVSAGEKFRHYLEGTGELPRFRKGGESIRRYFVRKVQPRGARGGFGDAKGIDPELIRNDRVLAAYYRFQVLANLYEFSRHYRANKLVASRAGRPYDVHGNQGGFVMGFDPYQVFLSDFVDSIWFESAGFSSRDLFEKGWGNAWGPFRFQMGEAMSGGRKPVLIMSRFEGFIGSAPELQAHSYAEASAGGGALMVGAHEVGPDPESLTWLNAFFEFRDANRAIFELKGRRRHAQVAVLYSLPTFLWDHAVPEFSGRSLSDLGGVARALEEGHVPYEVVILGMSEIRPDPFPGTDLSRYRVIVAPSVSLLSEEQVVRLQEFGERGGTLIVVGDLGTRDEKGLARETKAREGLRTARFVKRPLGSGMFPSSRRTESPQLKELWRQISDGVRTAVAQPLIGSTLPRWTWVKTWTHDGGLFSAHFVNYDFDLEGGRVRPSEPVRVSIRLPASVEPDEATWRVPGKPDRELLFDREPGGISVLLPSLQVYGVLVVGRKGAADEANALRQGDRYLLRARTAGKPLSDTGSRVAAVERMRTPGSAAAYAAAARKLLEGVAAEREARYLRYFDSIADPGQHVLALDFGGKKDHGAWKSLGPDDLYRPARGYGWLMSSDPSMPTPEERDYRNGSKMQTNANGISAGRIGTWPQVTPAPLVLRANLFSGRRQRLRIDVPAGWYRVDVVNTNPSLSRRNFFVSGATWAGGEAVLFDVPLNSEEVLQRSFIAEASGEGLDLEFGAATGWGIAALVVRRAAGPGAPTGDEIERGGIRNWSVSPRHPNPSWVPLQDVVPPPRNQLAGPPPPQWTPIRGPAAGLPIVDLGTTREARVGDVVYAATVLDSTDSKKVKLRFGSTSSAEVWLNGERVASLPNVKGVQRNEAVVELLLAKGQNVLVLGLERFWERRWLFYASVTPADNS